MDFELLADHVRTYTDLQWEEGQLQRKKQDAREKILDLMKDGGIKETEVAGFKVNLSTQFRETIDIGLAKALVDQVTFSKILKQSSNITLRITAVKQGVALD